MKRIMFVSDHASPLASLGSADGGGQNVYVAELARALAAKNYEVDVFTRRDREDQCPVVHWLPGVRIIHIDAGPAKAIAKESLLPFMAQFTTNVLRFISEDKSGYSLIHAHFFMSGMVARRLSEVLSIPFGITFHALGKIRKMHQGDDDRFPEERAEIECQLVKQADFLIAECPQDEQDLIQYYQADPVRIFMVPCGFSGREFYPVPQQEARQRLGLHPDDKIVLQLGRMVKRKGVDNVIEAMRYLKQVIPEVKLVVVGGDNDWEKTSEYQRLFSLGQEAGLSDRIRFTGPQSRDVLRDYYCAADVFVSTPWYEPFGITPLEAMACGRPVVGSAVGGIKFTVQDSVNGCLVPPKDPQALAGSLARLFSDKAKAEQMGMNGLKMVKELFTWEKVACGMEKVYVKTFHLLRTRRALPWSVKESTLRTQTFLLAAGLKINAAS